MRRPYQKRSTPEGEHRPVLIDDVMKILAPAPGMIIVDCTAGWAGHSSQLLQSVGPTGLLVALDRDADNLPKARERLEAVGHPFHLHHANFAGLLQVLGEHGITQVDGLVADLGMSSMQVDDAQRGFSYARDGTLDMRMDRSKGRTAAQVLASISHTELAQALHEYGDEPHAETIAAAIVAARSQAPIATTKELSHIIQQATGQERWQLHPEKGKWNLHPAARTFQALRIVVNRELSNLDNLLRIIPSCLKPGGAACIISFHSGEDRLVKNAFRSGLSTGIYAESSADPVRANYEERTSNPRSRSAKMRWVRRAP